MHVAYLLLITTTILITIKEESYLTISKIVSYFKHGHDHEMKINTDVSSLPFEQTLIKKLFNPSDF